MIVTKSKSKLITVIIHFSIWAVFGLIYFFQPISYNIVVPYQLWIKQCLILGMLVIAFYLNSIVFVPQFLLRNRTNVYLVAIVAVTAVIVVLNAYADSWLNIDQL